MDLKYIIQLSDEEIIQLINYCITERNKTEEIEEVEIDCVQVMNESDRKDLEGNRYVMVYSAANEGVLQLHWYKITDYTMQTNDIGFKNINYDETFKIFMTKKFGEEYLVDLYDLRINQAYYENAKLSEYLPTFGTRN